MHSLSWVAIAISILALLFSALLLFRKLFVLQLTLRPSERAHEIELESSSGRTTHLSNIIAGRDIIVGYASGIHVLNDVTAVKVADAVGKLLSDEVKPNPENSRIDEKPNEDPSRKLKEY